VYSMHKRGPYPLSIIKSKALAMMCFAGNQSASYSRCVAWTLTNIRWLLRMIRKKGISLFLSLIQALGLATRLRVIQS
jgi:hypothetical protein